MMGVGGSDGKEKEGAERDGLGGGHGIRVIQLTANRRRGGATAAETVSVPEAGIRCAPFPACLSHACSEL